MVNSLTPRGTSNRLGWTIPTGMLAASRDFDRLVGEMFGNSASNWSIPMSYWEEDDKLHFEAEVPGASADDLNLVVHDNTLTLSFERKSAEERPEGHRSEFRYGRFERSVSLPETADGDTVDANLNDGILHVTLNKRAELQPKRIEVKSK